MDTKQLQDVRADFSNLVRAASQEKVTVITVNGYPQAALVPVHRNGAPYVPLPKSVTKAAS